MKKLANIFNVAVVGLYAATEIIQDYAHDCETLYDFMPFGAQAMQFHLSGFFGAASLNWAATTVLKDYAGKSYKEAAAVTSLATLAVYEGVNIHNHFDWRDMGVYGAAVALSYTINKCSDMKEGCSL